MYSNLQTEIILNLVTLVVKFVRYVFELGVNISVCVWMVGEIKVYAKKRTRFTEITENIEYVLTSS